MSNHIPVRRIGVSITEAALILGIGRSSIYALINSGRLHPKKIGARTILNADEVQRLLVEEAS